MSRRKRTRAGRDSQSIEEVLHGAHAQFALLEDLLNLIERWFAELTTKQLRRGVHRSVPALEAAIREFIEAHNTKGRPFVWTKSADEILASIGRFAQRTLNLTPARQHMSRTIGTGH